MVTFKPVIISSNRRADGSYAVYIRVTFRGVSRRLPTSLVCQPSDLTRAGKIKNPLLLDRAADLIRRMRAPLQELTPFELEGRDVDWVVARIRDALSGETFRLDLFEWADRYLGCKTATTRRAYTQALQALERFLGRRELDVNDITRALLLDFMGEVDRERKIHYDPVTGERTEGEKEKVSRGASSRHLMKLAHIFNAAKDRYNDEDSGRILIPRSPFDKIPKYFPPSHGQEALEPEVMQRLIDADPSEPSRRAALDAFLLSFCLMGVNLVDLYNAPAFAGDVWRFFRQKTHGRRADGAQMQVRVPAEAAPFLGRLRSRAGSPWWLAGLRRLGKDPDAATRNVNKALRSWCRAEGLPVFTFGAARHSWATLARRAGVEKATVDECLAHKGDFSVTDIYAERSWELMWQANRTVLALFRWPGQEGMSSRQK